MNSRQARMLRKLEHNSKENKRVFNNLSIKDKTWLRKLFLKGEKNGK